MITAIRYPIGAIGLLIAALFAPACAAVEEAPVLAKLGGSALTEHDVRASLLDVGLEARDGLLQDPQRVGNLLKTILLRRAMVEEARDWLGDDKADQVADKAEQEALAKLALEFLSRTEDERSVEQLARRLHAEVEPEPVYDFDLVTVPAAVYGWEEARSVAQRLHESLVESPEETLDSLSQGENESGPKAAHYESVKASALNRPVRTTLQALSPGEFSEPIPVAVGFQLARLNAKGEAPTPSFEDSRWRWMEKARLQLAQQGRKELRSLHEEHELAEMALEAGLHRRPIGEAYVRMAIEEALLAAFKEAYLDQEMPDVEALARERYIADRDQFKTVPMGDVAVVRVRGLDGDRLDEWQEQLETHVESAGIADFVQQVRALTGAAAVQSNAARDVPLKILETDDLRLVSKLIADGRHVAVADAGYGTTFIALENYRPPQPRSFADVKEDLIETIRREMAEIIWRRKTAPYSQLALEADPEAIAALRSLGSSG